MAVIWNYASKLFSTPPSSLPTRISSLNDDDSVSLSSILIDLTNHPHTSLEQQLRGKVSKISKATFEKALDEALKSDKAPPKNLLETCIRIFDCESLKKTFNSGDLLVSAQREARFTPAPSSSVSKIASPLITYGQSYLPTFVRLLVSLFYFPAKLVHSGLQSAWETLEDASKEHYNHSHTRDFYQSRILYLLPNLKENFILLAGYAYAINNYYLKNYYLNSYLDLAKFPKRKNYALAVTAATYAITYYVCRYKLNLTTFTAIDKDEVFQNINEQVKAGLIKPGRSRIEEMEKLAIHLVRQPGFDVDIPFITGPSGVGKTKLIKDLAYRCVNDPNFIHFGKTVFLINTAKLLEKPKLLAKVLRAIQGKQDNVILCFDEGHSGGETKHAKKHAKSPGTTNLLQHLKTDILDHNILCVMATTTEEYNNCIGHDPAFVSRLKSVELQELNHNDTKNLLKEHVQKHLSSMVEVTEDGYETIVKTADEDKTNFNPRKSLKLLKSVISKAQGWNPTQQQIDLQKGKDTERNLEMECQEKSENDPDWTNSDEGTGKFKELQESRKKIQDSKIESLRKEYENIQKIQTLFSQSRAELARLVHQVAKASTPEVEKHYFYTKFVTVPALKRLLKTKIDAFNQESPEKICSKIDADFVKSVFAS